MANKYYRENLRNGTNPTKRKSNIAKIMETFGPKKKVKKEKPKKRMFANMGGGADSGRMGEIKSKVTLLGDKFKKISEKINNKKIKVFDKETNKDIFIDKDVLMNNLKRYRPSENTTFKSTVKDALKMKKGGRAALKKGSKFPDHSGDGKITQKDILMAKGVIPKTKSKKKII